MGIIEYFIQNSKMDKRSDHTPENASKTAAKLAERDLGIKPVGRPARACPEKAAARKAGANEEPVLQLGFVSDIADSE